MDRWDQMRAILAYAPTLALLGVGIVSMLTFAPLFQWVACQNDAPCVTGSVDLLGPVLLIAGAVCGVIAYRLLGRGERAARARELGLT